jgi:hypothetical protein
MGIGAGGPYGGAPATGGGVGGMPGGTVVVVGGAAAGAPQDPQKELFGSISDPHFEQKAISASFAFMDNVYSYIITCSSLKSM